MEEGVSWGGEKRKNIPNVLLASFHYDIIHLCSMKCGIVLLDKDILLVTNWHLLTNCWEHLADNDVSDVIFLNAGGHCCSDECSPWTVLLFL